MDSIVKYEKKADRVIVFTDEQDCDLKPNPAQGECVCKANYLVKVASFKNGIAYGKNAHRWLVRVGHRVHPRVGADGEGELNRIVWAKASALSRTPLPEKGEMPFLR